MSSRPQKGAAATRPDVRVVLERRALAPTPSREDVELESLIGRLPIGIVSVNPLLRIDYLNSAAAGYLGAGAVGALLPDPWPDFSLRKFARRLFTESPPARRIVEIATGRFVEVEAIPPAEETNGLLVMQDVTARERRNLAEREFVANAAHELRTPLAAIAAALDVLEGGAKETPSDRDLFLGHVRGQSDRLRWLAETLLLLARVQTGQEAPSLELVAVRPLLEDVAGRLEPRDGVEVRIRCPAAVRVLADVNLLGQALWNVAANAVTHTRAGHVTLSASDRGATCEIEVRDTGPGIDDADRERIFERFVRGRGRDAGGFGLGLSLTREIVHTLGGSVRLDSRAGAGTRVRITLPSARVVRE